MRTTTLALGGLVLLSALCGQAQNRGNPLIRFEGQSIDDMIAAFMAEHDVPGMSLAIVQAPYITRAAGYGVSDTQLRTLVSANTIFNIADMKHAFTAVAAMQLVEQGKLELAVVLPLIRDPGASTKLDDAVAKASGRTYQEFVRDGQFDRIGLKHTFFGSELPSIAREKLEPNGRHQRFLREPVLINPTEPAVPADVRDASVAGARAIYSSASDVSVWDIALAGEILVKDPALRKLLYEPQSSGGVRIPSSGPWFFPGRPGLMVATGSANGYSSLLSRFTHRDELLCVTLLANREGLDLTQLARRIAGAYNAKLGPPPEAADRRFQQSPYSVTETIARLERVLQKRGVAVETSGVSVLERENQVWVIVDPSKMNLEARTEIDRALLETIAPNAGQEPSSPFAAASGVTRADAVNGPFRVVPLRPMTGDVEILYGDPEKAGEPFAMRIRELPGTIIPLHSHPVDEHIIVVQGTWYFAVGDQWDRAALRELRAGDYAFARKGSKMFGYCPDGAIVQVQGVGPFHIHWVHGSKTLDDADASSTFTFRRGDRVSTPRGVGTIRNGYASGTIIQYEVAGDDGVLFMTSQSDMQRHSH